MSAKLIRQPHKPTEEHPLDGLARWLADCLVDEAAAARSRQRSLEQQAAQEASIAGVLLNLAERGRLVNIKTLTGQTCEGHLTSVGADFVFMHAHENQELLIPNRSIAVIKSSGTNCLSLGTRTPSTVCLADTLEWLAADKAHVEVVVADETVRGRLQTSGTDLIAISVATKTDLSQRDLIHIATTAIDHMTVLLR